MVISDKSTAAQLVGSGGLVRHYDDIGCLLEDRRARTELADTEAWVLDPTSDAASDDTASDHDESDDSERWIRASESRFESGGLTPMGYGYIAAIDGELSFEEVAAAVLETDRRHEGERREHEEGS